MDKTCNKLTLTPRKITASIKVIIAYALEIGATIPVAPVEKAFIIVINPAVNISSTTKNENKILTETSGQPYNEQNNMTGTVVIAKNAKFTVAG